MSTQETRYDETSRSDESVVIPTKGVDPDATLEDRLTANVRNRIGPARYFEKDEDGNPVENWDGAFERVAENIAEAELIHGGEERHYQQWKDAFEQSMRELRFVPNSPTIMNAGLPLQQLSACFVTSPHDTMESINETQSEAADIFKCLDEQSRVTVAGRGSVSISDVSIGDSVLTADGSWGSVTETHTYQDAPVYTVELDNGIEITGTPNHELFVGEKPVRIDELDVGDELTISLNWFKNTGPVSLDSVPATLWESNDKAELHDEIRSGVDAGKSDYEIAADVSYSASTVQRHRKDVLGIDAVHDTGAQYDGGYNTGWSESGVNGVVQPESLTDNLAWLLGLWVGDGSYHEDGIRFHLSSNSVIDRVDETVTTLFDTDVSTVQSDGCMEVGIYSSAVKRFWQENFGDAKPDGAQSACIPDVIWHGDRSHAISFLRGVYDADGTVLRGSYPSLTTSSTDLAQDVQQLLHGLGIEATVWNDDDARMQVRPVAGSIDRFFHLIGCNESYTVKRDVTDTEPITESTVPVSSVTKSGTSTVYDITVENDHEYVASSVRSHNSGGGVGYAFHHLRPKGARVASTGGVSSGPLSFMELYDVTCGTVKQGGKRRGAQMAIMHVQHPDIGRFAVSKRGEDSFTNFNISMGLTDDFIEAVKNDEEYTLYAPQTRPTEQHDLRDGEPFEVVPETAHFYNPEFADAWNDEYDKPGVGLDGKVVEENFWRDYADELESDFSEFRDRIDLEPGEPMTLPARFIWQLLIDGAWNNGEPGIFNLDEANRQHSFDVEEHFDHRIHATNPCSEQPLEEYEACNLGHVNLSLMVDETAPRFDAFQAQHDLDDTEQAVEAYLNRALDQDQFEETIRTGVRFLDNVVTMSEFPLEEISREVRNKRKIGLGLMGFHQMLMQMGVEYGSEVSYEFARETMRRIDAKATTVSHELATEREPFHEYEESKWANPTEYPEWFEQHAHRDPEDWAGGFPMRNHNVTTIAPTGTTSLIGNTTGGCEPLPQVAYMKNVGDDIQGEEHLVEFDDYFLRTLEANDIDVEAVTEEAEQQMLDNEFEGVDSLDAVPDTIGDVFVTTGELSGEQHIRMQAAFQEYCDSGISKCVAEGTVVKTDDGLRRIEDLGTATEAEADSFASAHDTTIDGNDVTEHYNGGEKPAVRVRFDNGATLTAARDSHHVKTTDGWTLVSELEPGDHVIGSYEESHGAGSEPIEYDDEFYGGAKTIETPNKMSVELAEWLGMMVADGHTVESSGAVGITHKNETVGNRFNELTSELLGVEPDRRVDDRNGVVSLEVTSRNLVRFVESLIGSGAYEKRVPEQVLAGSADEKLAFARGLTLDGYDHENGFVVYEGMSERVARDTASMLRSFGVPRVYVGDKHVSESDATAYSVLVSNEVQEHVEAIEPHKNNETVWCRYKVHVPTERYTLDDYDIGSDEYYAARSALNRDNDYMFDTTAEKIGVEHDGPVHKVTSVEHVGQVQMYDIEVEDEHQYVSNSVVSHNTLNMPYDTDIEEVGEAFMLAYDLGIKGTTVYRSGSRNEQVIKENVEEREFSDEEKEELLEEAKALVRKDDEARSVLSDIIAQHGGE